MRTATTTTRQRRRRPPRFYPSHSQTGICGEGVVNVQGACIVMSFLEWGVGRGAWGVGDTSAMRIDAMTEDRSAETRLVLGCSSPFGRPPVHHAGKGIRIRTKSEKEKKALQDRRTASADTPYSSLAGHWNPCDTGITTYIRIRKRRETRENIRGKVPGYTDFEEEEREREREKIVIFVIVLCHSCFCAPDAVEKPGCDTPFNSKKKKRK